MPKIYRLIIFLKNMATGIMAPVLMLTLLSRGASLSEISLLMGAYSLTVILAEFPSGVAADLFGRKTVFMLSLVFFFLCYMLILFSHATALLFAAMISNGLGRALSTGSIDALIIDESGLIDGDLVKLTSRLSVTESAGMAFGAITGGLLTGIGDQFAGNLGTNLFIYTLLFFLTLLFVHEKHILQDENEKPLGALKSISVQIKVSFTFMMRSKARMLFVLSLFTGFALFSIETYWQPALAGFSPPGWSFGALSFAGFLWVILGSKLAEKRLIKHPGDSLSFLLGQKVLLGACLLLLVFRFSPGFFMAIYMLMYVFLGSGSVVENTLLNQAAPAKQRAGVLSLFSFVMQIGGLLASLSGYFISSKGEFRNLWLIAGGLLILSAGSFAITDRLKRQKQGSAANLS